MRLIEQRDFPGLASLYLASLDGSEQRVVEFVDTIEPGVDKSRKWVMMVSTQLGCPVGCLMCDAGSLGFRGNLTAEEMLAQIRFILARNPDLSPETHPKLKIHLARMGEPSLNPETLRVLELLAREYPFPGIMPSLSTVAPDSPAIRPYFERLIEVKDACFPKGRFQLQFSIHSMDERRRREIVPIKAWSLPEIADYGRRFHKKGDRKITLNFALMRESEFDPEKAASIFDPERFLIKITPVNPTAVSEGNGETFLWNEPPPSIQALATALESKGFQVILSPSAPEEVEAETSCGQLWSRKLREDVRTALRNRRRERDSYVSATSLESKAGEWERLLADDGREPREPSLENSALLVIDMQEFFLNPRSPAYRPSARAVLGNVRRLVEAFRGASRPVCFSLHAHEDPEQDGGLMRRWWPKICLAGTAEAAIPRILGPRWDEIFRKSRYTAFSNPDLERWLRRQGVQRLVICGIMTNLCVESSARDAFDRGFESSVVLDATAAHTEIFHLASLRNLAFGFSSVLRAEAVIDGLKAAV